MLAVQASAEDIPLHPAEQRCEYLINPLGIDETSPHLCWVDASSRRAECQTAYQILVASDPQLLIQDKGDLWDSGKVESSESAHIAYAGKILESRVDCFWKVRVWDGDNRSSDWSPVAYWSMGLLSPGDWQARWIDTTHSLLPIEVTLPVAVQRATYRTTDGRVTHDVTSLVAQQIRDGHPVAPLFAVNNTTMGGDPAYNQTKELLVTFTRGNERVETTVPEGENSNFYGEVSALRYLRRPFAVRSKVRQATLYVTALGLYECSLNGQRVGDHVLAPDWTDYKRRVRYQAYDVTASLRPGENVLGALLANGWYAGHLGNGNFQLYGKIPALLAQLEITYEDGRVERIVSDDSWRTHASPTLKSDFMLGESYDARQEVNGWDRPGFGGSDWKPATVRNEPARALNAQVAPPVRQTGERKATSLTEPGPGRWTFDFGQNMVGVVRLKVAAPAGTVITLHHAEILNPDGTIYTTNLRGAPSVDTYTCKGGGVETWQPSFTFHGFRYAELTGLPAKPPNDAATGIVVNTDDPVAGSFTCSDPRINQLVSNIAWGQRGNYLSVPTDCPQRDERLGWMGDAQVFVRTATDLADVAAFYAKWLVDVDDAQNPDGAFTVVSPDVGLTARTPAWSDAGVICPWTIYLAYGDKRILQRHLPAMTKWVEWCRTNSTGLLRDRERGGDFGDWLSQGADTPKDVIGTAYFAYSAQLVAKACHVVGDETGAKKYEALFDEICHAFNMAYVAPDGRIKGNTQCVYAMALKFGLLPAELRPKAAEYLAADIAAHNNHLTTGFVGVSYLLPTLTVAGRLDTAYALLTQETFPSWLFSVKQGATTIWERWDGWTPDKGFQDASMNSFNHYSLGSCGEWLYGTVAGIGWDETLPGYRHLIIHPRLGGGLSMVKAERRTLYGLVRSEWRLQDGRMALDVSVPANVTAQVILPIGNAAAVLLDGKPLNQSKDVTVATATSEGETSLQIGSGLYRFECPAQPTHSSTRL